MRKALVWALFWGPALSAASAQEKPAPQPIPLSTVSPEMSQISSVLKSNFAEYHLAPIVIPEGERVGDIIDVNNAILIAGPDDCFPGLKPRETVSLLPQVTFESEKELAAAVGASNIAGAGGEVRAGRAFKLDFEEVRVEGVSQYQLRKALSKNAQECDLVRPFLDAAYSSAVSSHRKIAQHGKRRVTSADIPQSILTDKPAPLVVGTLFYARRVIHVAATDKAAGEAGISFVEQFIRRLGLGANFKASVGGDAYSKSMIDIRSNNIVPVAFKPAYVVTSTKKLAKGKTKYEIANIDQAAIEHKIRIARKRELESEKYRIATQKAAEEAEAEVKAAAAAKTEADRLAAEKAAEKAEAERRLASAKTEARRIIAQKTEAERESRAVAQAAAYRLTTLAIVAERKAAVAARAKPSRIVTLAGEARLRDRISRRGYSSRTAVFQDTLMPSHLVGAGF